MCEQTEDNKLINEIIGIKDEMSFKGCFIKNQDNIHVLTTVVAAWMGGHRDIIDYVPHSPLNFPSLLLDAMSGMKKENAIKLYESVIAYCKKEVYSEEYIEKYVNKCRKENERMNSYIDAFNKRIEELK